MVQVMVPDESRGDVSVHGFWKWDTFALFDMQIVNLDLVSYLCQTSVKDLESVEKKKKEKHLYPCLDLKSSFTTMGTPQTEFPEQRLQLCINV